MLNVVSVCFYEKDCIDVGTKEAKRKVKVSVDEVLHVSLQKILTKMPVRSLGRLLTCGL